MSAKLIAFQRSPPPEQTDYHPAPSTGVAAQWMLRSRISRRSPLQAVDKVRRALAWLAAAKIARRGETGSRSTENEWLPTGDS